MYSNDPILKWHVSEEIWEVWESFTVTWKGRTWRVTSGFRTDLASIPRFFRRLIPKVGRHLQAAIVHDYFYVHGGITKEEADKMFLDGMEHLNVPGWKIKLMYHAVRIGGKGSW